MTILSIALNNPLRQCFDYLPNPSTELAQLQPGVRVRVPFGRREAVGIITAINQHSLLPHHKLKPIAAVLDTTPLLSPHLLALGQWASSYYQHSLGEVLVGTLPTLLQQGAPAIIQKTRAHALDTTDSRNPTTSPLALNAQQAEAVQAVSAAFGQFKPFLLAGITGSGKTEVYLQLIAQVLAQGQQALVLVPEIALTPQTVQRFQARFAVPIVALHSGLSDRQRLNGWVQAQMQQASIVIGTRSAIFAPLPQLGLIIVDEEHDLSFKQQEGFRYSARDLSIIRAQLANVPIVLGSATPSLESWHNAQSGRYQLLILPERAGAASVPSFRLIDLRNQTLDHGLAPALLQAIHHHLAQAGQVLLFLNRRGFAPTLICPACGWVALCPRCDARLILHQNPHPHWVCHHCSTTQSPLTACPTCHHSQLKPLGAGTERIEQALQKHFPDEQILRIDRDTTRRKGALQGLLTKIHEGAGRILIGTQMLAKGHHFPNVTLVGVINADNGLLSADFRATERTAQLLLQVAGRAGRAQRPSEVLIQTYYPEHPLLNCLITAGYARFADAALAERQQAALPPYAYLTLLRAEATQAERPLAFLHAVATAAQTLAPANKLQILGPVPAAMPRKAGHYRAQLLLQASQRATLQNLLPNLLKHIATLKSTRQVRWALDVDPVEVF